MKNSLNVLVVLILLLALQLSAFACDASKDLEVTRVGKNGFTFYNKSDTCLYRVGVATYKKFDESDNHQELYSVLNAVDDVTQDGVVPLKKRQSRTLYVDLPSCSYQIYAFHTQLIKSFGNGERYGDRLLSTDKGNLNSYCLKPTPIPSPTPTVITPVCSLGTVSFPTVPCSATSSQIKLNTGGSSSGNYSWSSTCRNANFDNPTAAQPVLTFLSSSTIGSPGNCTVSLIVTNSRFVVGSCSAQIKVGSCYRDCEGTIDGTAKADRCGVCKGDGQSCLGCSTVNSLGEIQALDVQAATLRNVAFSANRLLILRERNQRHFISSRTISIVRSSNAKVEAEYQSMWNTAYSIPAVSTSCTNTSFCSQVVTTQSQGSYAQHKLTLVSEVDQALRRLGVKDRNFNSSIRQLIARRNTASRIADGALSKIPNAGSNCN